MERMPLHPRFSWKRVKQKELEHTELGRVYGIPEDGPLSENPTPQTYGELRPFLAFLPSLGTVTFDRCPQIRFLAPLLRTLWDEEFAIVAQSLPLHLNLSDMEAQVRHLLHRVRRGDAPAVARWYSLDPEARTGQPRKADIQKHSWPGTWL